MNEPPTAILRTVPLLEVYEDGKAINHALQDRQTHGQKWQNGDKVVQSRGVVSVACLTLCVCASSSTGTRPRSALAKCKMCSSETSEEAANLHTQHSSTGQSAWP